MNIGEVGEVAVDGSGDATVASAEEALDSSEGWRRRTFCGWASIYVETIAHGEDVGSSYGDSQCQVSGRVRVQDESANHEVKLGSMRRPPRYPLDAHDDDDDDDDDGLDHAVSSPGTFTSPNAMVPHIGAPGSSVAPQACTHMGLSNYSLSSDGVLERHRGVSGRNIPALDPPTNQGVGRVARTGTSQWAYSEIEKPRTIARNKIGGASSHQTKHKWKLDRA